MGNKSEVSNINSTNICLFSCCMQRANIKPFHDCSSALNGVAKTLFLIAIYQGEAPKISYDVENVYEIVNVSYNSQLLAILGYLNTQMKVLCHFFSIRHEVDICVFYLGNISILQTLVAKVFRKKTVLLLGGCLEKEILLTNDPFGKLKLLLHKANLRLIDQIAGGHPNLKDGVCKGRPPLSWNCLVFYDKTSLT
jgi:hypothetical protein